MSCIIKELMNHMLLRVFFVLVSLSDSPSPHFACYYKQAACSSFPSKPLGLTTVSPVCFPLHTLITHLILRIAR